MFLCPIVSATHFTSAPSTSPSDAKACRKPYGLTRRAGPARRRALCQPLEMLRTGRPL